jgi:metal-responsive CopG/Arc/MetJ family transcriptional regulator
VSDKVAVEISKELYEKADKFIKEQGGFNSVAELIEFLLKEVIAEEEETAMSKEDEEKVKERLKSLGYL